MCCPVNNWSFHISMCKSISNLLQVERICQPSLKFSNLMVSWVSMTWTNIIFVSHQILKFHFLIEQRASRIQFTKWKNKHQPLELSKLFSHTHIIKVYGPSSVSGSHTLKNWRFQNLATKYTHTYLITNLYFLIAKFMC